MGSETRSPMSLDAKLVAHLEKSLALLDDQGTRGPRLRDNARRLWRRVHRFSTMDLLSGAIDLEPLELAAYALQLPHRQSKRTHGGKAARPSLRDRAEDAAEMLVTAANHFAEEALLDRTTRLLHEMPHKSPVLDEAKLLADAVNLEDFGVIGLIEQAIQLGRQGDGLHQLADGLEKREEYGYWAARIRDGFHFAAVRKIAEARLTHARSFAKLLTSELSEDGFDQNL